MARITPGLAPIASLTLACALWGVATVIAKSLLGTVPPITLLVLQLVPSVVLLWILVVTNRTGSLRRSGLLPVALLGLLNPGWSYMLSMFGLTMTSASVATLLWAAEPALIVAAAWLLLRERATARLLLALAAAGGGVLLVSGIAAGGGLAGATGRGAALVLAGVLCCALYTVLSRKIISTIDPLPAVAVQQTVGLAWAVAIWPLEAGRIGAMAALSTGQLAAAALAGLMYYAAAFWLYLNALRSVTATTAGIFLNLTPVFGVATAYIFLGERLMPGQWLGAAMTLAAVLALLAWGAGEPRTARSTVA